MLLYNLRDIAPNLERDPGGWWTVRTRRDISYPIAGNDACFSVEDSSFWFRHRNRCITAVLGRFPPAGALFDVGGGNGCVARAIQDIGLEVVVVEPGAAGVRNAVSRGVRHVVRSALEDIDLLPATLPAASLFDVLEHIRDDGGFLNGLHELLIPEGRLYLTVPAYQSLWSGE